MANAQTTAGSRALRPGTKEMMISPIREGSYKVIGSDLQLSFA
jgi:hypothetical protein